MINRTLTRIRFRSSFRDPEMKLWIFLFPTLLYLILSVIFVNIGAEGFHFRVALLDRTGWNDRSAQDQEGIMYRGSQILHSVFEEISQAEEGKKPLFSFIVVDNEEEALEMLRMERVSLYVEIPEDFNLRFNQLVLLGGFMGDRIASPLVHVHRISARQFSHTAGEVMEQVLRGINLEAARQVQWDLIDMERQYEFLGRSEDFSYAGFLLISVVLMTILMVGVFYMSWHLAWFRSEGVLKSFQVTPMKPVSFIISLVVEQFFTIVCAIVLLVLIANLKDQVGFGIFHPRSVAYLLLMVLTSMTLGTLIGAVSKTAKASESLSQFVFFPLLFLGGLFFVGGGFAGPIQWAMNANPMTWIGYGIRHELGIMNSPHADQYYLHFLVPLIWIAVALGISIQKIRLEVK